MLSCVGIESLEGYRNSKFKIWEASMLNVFGGCAAAFLPELRRGFALNNLFDHNVFPSPPEERADWEIDNNGKIVIRPRPVRGLRIWNSQTKQYDDVDPVMAGAPRPEETEVFWASFLDKLREELNPKYGENFIDDCLTKDLGDVKAKYFS